MFGNIDIGNANRNFDMLQQERLGLYVYALLDPRDGKIFYIGQGRNNRIFDHFNDAENKLRSNRILSSKEIRILDIWKNSEDVVWKIIAHKLSDESANATEAALIDSMSVSPNGPCLNEVRGPRSSMLSEGEVATLGASPVNPDTSYSSVFMFPVHNALSDSRENIYEATRAAWSVSKHNRSRESHAVGIKNGISIGGFSIDRWKQHGDKFAFSGADDKSLVNFDWKPIISQTIGYWQRGNYLIVEFDGHGLFRFLRGSQKRDWLEL